MSMADLLEPARVLANVEARSKKHAFEILSELIAGVADDLSHDQIFEALVERERIGNTGMGKGVAIPHGTVPGLTAPTAACLKLSEAVDYGAQDGEPVALILAVALPDHDESKSFEDVAHAARVLADPELRHMLGDVSSSRALFELLTAHVPAGPISLTTGDSKASAAHGNTVGDKSTPDDGWESTPDDAISVD